MTLANSKTFGDFLIDNALLTATDQENVLRVCQDNHQRPIPVIARITDLNGARLARAVSEFYESALVKADDWPEKLLFRDDLKVEFLKRNNILPVSDTSDGLLLAMEDPTDTETIKAVGLATGRSIIPRIASREDIQRILSRLAQTESPNGQADPSPQPVSSGDVEQLRDLALGAPIIRFVDDLLTEASRARATDIHIEPFDGKLAIRLRVDGMLRLHSTPPVTMGRMIASRVKIIAGLNIAEKRLPQDGRVRINIEGRQFDLRVATMPTIHGEAITIRLLDNVRRALDFANLGFDVEQEQKLRRHLRASHGLIIVTGPTGSGKTTTLATAISALNENHRKILTIEDPIEYEIEGVNQSQVKPEIGMSFANALRAFMRHDPDVLMVGEIRDTETARIALHAALTGHLVLTTLHTNSAAGAIVRLLDMGVDAFILASTLKCVIGQRLVRLLCPDCKTMRTDDSDVSELLLDAVGAQSETRVTFSEAGGCETCMQTGYRDRTALLETLDVSAGIRPLIREGITAQDIEEVARREGMKTMAMDGMRKCSDGLTTPEEVIRVAIGT